MKLLGTFLNEKSTSSPPEDVTSGAPDSDDLQVVEPDHVISGKPDKYTKKAPSSFVDGGVPGQVFKFTFWGFSYGTDDKSHAAALIFSFLLILIYLIFYVLGIIFDRNWIPDQLDNIGTLFTLVVGVAIGQGSKK